MTSSLSLFLLFLKRYLLLRPIRHMVACWGQMADQARGIRKGDVVQVEGKIRTRSYDKGGEKRYVTEIIATKIVCDSGDREPQIERDDVPERSEDEIPF